jgi:hypothetical protein
MRGDGFERRSWLVSEAYEVLRRMETPVDGASDIAIFLSLSRAFSEEAAAVANFEAAAPRSLRKSRTPTPT